MFFHNVLDLIGIYCLKQFVIAIGKVTERKGDDIIVKSSENYFPAEIECVKILGFYRIFNAKLG